MHIRPQDGVKPISDFRKDSSRAFSSNFKKPRADLINATRPIRGRLIGYRDF